MTRSESTATAGIASVGRRLVRWGLLVAAPLLLGAVLWFHPHAGTDVYDSLEPVADAWLLVHLLMLPLFGLLGISLYVLLDEFSGPVATIGRVGIAVYLVFYLAFEAVAGIATGVLLREARELSPERRAGVAEVVEVIFTEPVTGIVPLLALVGTAGAVVAVAAIGILYRRSGASVVPVAFLAGAPLSLVVHGGGRLDVLGMVLFAVGAAWLEAEWRRRDGRDAAAPDGTELDP